jgi:probable rRNA maturation factor
MIKVIVTKESNYPVKAPEIKKKLRNFLIKKGIVSDCVVSVAIVGEKEMLKLGKKYLQDEGVHNVLSFSEPEVKKGFKYPPDGKIYLGEIVVCYPKIIAEANLEGKLINQKAYELVEHGALHLLGFHHS